MKILASGAPAPGHAAASGRDVIARLTTAMKSARLDCQCRSQLDEALDRFAAMERRREMRADLADACGQRRRIEAILVFLQDLDDLGATEQDYSVYNDIALLFDDIAGAAAEGAEAMRRLHASNEP